MFFLSNNLNKPSTLERKAQFVTSFKCWLSFEVEGLYEPVIYLGFCLRAFLITSVLMKDYFSSFFFLMYILIFISDFSRLKYVECVGIKEEGCVNYLLDFILNIQVCFTIWTRKTTYLQNLRSLLSVIQNLYFTLFIEGNCMYIYSKHLWFFSSWKCHSVARSQVKYCHFISI